MKCSSKCILAAGSVICMLLSAHGSGRGDVYHNFGPGNDGYFYGLRVAEDSKPPLSYVLVRYDPVARSWLDCGVARIVCDLWLGDNSFPRYWVAGRTVYFSISCEVADRCEIFAWSEDGSGGKCERGRLSGMCPHENWHADVSGKLRWIWSRGDSVGLTTFNPDGSTTSSQWSVKNARGPGKYGLNAPPLMAFLTLSGRLVGVNYFRNRESPSWHVPGNLTSWVLDTLTGQVLRYDSRPIVEVGTGVESVFGFPQGELITNDSTGATILLAVFGSNEAASATLYLIRFDGDGRLISAETGLPELSLSNSVSPDARRFFRYVAERPRVASDTAQMGPGRDPNYMQYEVDGRARIRITPVRVP